MLSIRKKLFQREAIINGEIKAGETLPTEPELAEQFNVSRAVIRDAARILMAWGLIDIRHGKGMYVTVEMNNYFMESISTILRRSGTSTWEMQEYEQLLLPEVFAQAAVNCTEKQKAEIKKQGQIYIDFIWTGKDDADLQKELFLTFINLIFEGTNNKVLALMGQIQQFSRELRHITGDEGREQEFGLIEEKSVRLMIEAVNSGDSERARKLVSKVFKVGSKIEKIMRGTPLGQNINIPADIFLEEIGLED
jgi:GntR family transcriptional repressor for pyruvate dehydrogenase complex